MTPTALAAFFVVSGFCGLVYEVVWLRLAMAQFGVNTALASIVLSAFMAGLGLGSWLAGILARRARGPRGALRLYATAELAIAAGGILVPTLLACGGRLLAGAPAEWGSGTFYWASGACVAAALVPWCAAMGATIPLAMDALRRARPDDARTSFSLLYLANVLGAALGCLVCAFILIEALGLRGAGLAAAALNAALAAAAYAWAEPLSSASARAEERGPARGSARTRDLVLLFAAGFAAMGLEIVWTRQMIPYLGLHVYAFAAGLALYLLAYQLGAYAYRRARAPDAGAAWAAAGACGALTILAADPRVPFGAGLGGGLARLYLAVAPFSAASGYLTPLLVDRYGAGDPARAGKAYAANVLGCILGPLAASFALLPFVPERAAAAVLVLLLLAAGAALAPDARARRRTAGAALAVAVAALLARDYRPANDFGASEVRRDAAATVIAAGSRREQKQLYVNGIAMTGLAIITKDMAHLPLAFLNHPPRRALVVCFGMGTTFRSLLSWGIPATAVELIPSVPGLFGFFHADGPALLAAPGARVVVDDGRRFLLRTREKWDVITLDPAPPIESSGDSQLYGREFYAAAKLRLEDGGILHQYYWDGDYDPSLLSSVLGALTENFRYVRAFRMGGSGLHLLASDAPIAALSPAELAAKLPPAAAADMTEWSPKGIDARAQFALILANEIPLPKLIASLPPAPPLSDDRPRNEYYFLRRTAAALFGR